MVKRGRESRKEVGKENGGCVEGGEEGRERVRGLYISGGWGSDLDLFQARDLN